MRIAVCALSAVLLSGCSWLGMGGHGSSSNGQSGYYGADCGGQQGGAYGYQGGYSGAAGCGGAGGYGAYGAGSGHAGHGAGYGSGVSGFQGAYGGANGLGGAAGYGQAGYGQAGLAGYSQQAGYGAYGGATTLGANAPYGAGVGGNIVASQYGNGQTVAGGVRTVQGAPIYVNQPYAVPCGGQACGPQLRGGGQAMPFGFEVFGGTDFAVNGDIFGGKAASANTDNFATATAEIVAPAISYKDAFKDGYNVGGAMTYDLNRNTTLLGSVGYQKNEGRTFANGTFQPGSYDAAGTFTSSGPVENVTATMSDLEQISVEGGIRRYVGGWGHGGGLRPYVGASGGFTHNNSVDVTQSSDTTLAPFTQKYVDSGWTPTAAGIIGAEMAVGSRAALGIESGIRWRDNLDTNVGSDDRWSIPVQLRGRVSF